MPSSVAKYYRRKEVIALLDKLTEQRAQIDAFTPHLNVLYDQTIFSAVDILNQHIYRARLNCPGELFVHTKQISYPPPEMVLRKNRFNDFGESLFYGSLGMIEPVFEILPAINPAPRLFTLATIQKIKKAPFLAAPFGFPINQYQRPLKIAHRVPI